MKLARYEKIIKGKLKANFIKSKKGLFGAKNSAAIIAKDNDNTLEPLFAARLNFSGNSMHGILINKQRQCWSPKQTARWMEKRAREKKGIIINPGNIEENLQHINAALALVEKSAPIVIET